MRDLIVAIEAHHQKCYHLGLGKHVTRSNLSKANTNRDYRIFEDFAYYLVSEARRKRATDIFKLDGNVYAFDSTTISLCLDVFWWAKFRKYKGGFKIHTLLDLETQIPAFFHITTASVHDSQAMKEIPNEGLTGNPLLFLPPMNYVVIPPMPYSNRPLPWDGTEPAPLLLSAKTGMQ